jgi:large subunit ribosomal protein L35
MPKAKTRRAAAKRFRVTGTGKLIRGQARSKHLLEWKSPNVKRKMRRSLVVSPTNVDAIKKMLPGI